MAEETSTLINSNTEGVESVPPAAEAVPEPAVVPTNAESTPTIAEVRPPAAADERPGSPEVSPQGQGSDSSLPTNVTEERPPLSPEDSPRPLEQPRCPEQPQCPEQPRCPDTPPRDYLLQMLAKGREAIRVEHEANREKIVALAREKGKIKNADVRKLLGIHHAAATVYLSQLVKEGKLKKSGRLITTRYELN